MHYTGTIWRPPYEAASILLEVTAGCTHHKCKFCTLYNDLPFNFRMSPMEDIEDDLQEMKRAIKNQDSEAANRVFLTGANPFVLSYDKLIAIAAANGFNPALTAKGNIIVPKSATEGEGHKNKEEINIVIPNIHQVMAGVFMTFAMGAISNLSLPKSIRHFENAVTSAMVAIISINSFAAYKEALKTV